VIVDGDGKYLLGVFLTYYVSVKKGLHLLWGRKGFLRFWKSAVLGPLFRYDLVAEVYALITDIDAVARYELVDLFLILPAERTVVLRFFFAFSGTHPVASSLSVIMASTIPYSIES